MLMSSGGLVASSSGCATRPRAREVGSTGYTMPTQYSLLIGRYVMATAEHREPCDSRGSCTVLGEPEGEIPRGDSTAIPTKLPDTGIACRMSRTTATGIKLKPPTLRLVGSKVIQPAPGTKTSAHAWVDPASLDPTLSRWGL